MKKRWAVYDIFADDALLYVGITNRPNARLSQHKCRATVPYFATMRIVAWFDTPQEARQAERARIKELNPPRNIVHTARKDRRDGRIWLKYV